MDQSPEAVLTEEKVEEALAPLGLVIYTDGGCRPNPGFGGWGVHGYLYRNQVPKKGSGNSDYILTARGYKHKSLISKQIGVEGAGKRAADPEEVTPVHYLDAYGSFMQEVTNNIAEIVATTVGLKKALEYVVAEVQVYTDSEHVRNGLEKWVAGWQRNNWIKSDGLPVSNVELWKELVTVRDRLVERGVKVSIDWVKAHTDNKKDSDKPQILGNIVADNLATLGVMISRKRTLKNQITETAPEGYWKNENEKHPFFAHRRMFFNSRPEYLVAGRYYLGDQIKEEDLIGKRTADGTFSVVRLKEPDEVLELVRKYQTQLANGTDSLVMARLDVMFQSEIYEQLSKHGEVPLTRTSDRTRLDLCWMDDEKTPVTRELRPPMLAMRAVEAVSALEQQLDFYLEGHRRITVTDLTDHLYETVETVDKKKGASKVTTKLKDMYNVGYAALTIDTNYASGEGVEKAPVTLTLGIDMLDRNALKRLETLKPQVKLITWKEAEQVFRYATVIQAGEDVGIWAGVHSNLRIVS